MEHSEYFKFQTVRYNKNQILFVKQNEYNTNHIS